MQLKIQSEYGIYKLFGSIASILSLLTAISFWSSIENEKQINLFIVSVPIIVIIICIFFLINHFLNRYHSAFCDKNSIFFKSGKKEHQVYWNNIINIYYSSRKKAFLIETTEFSGHNMFWLYDNPEVSNILNNHHEPIKKIEQAYPKA